MSVDLPHPRPKMHWERKANDKKILISANICKTGDGFFIEIREAKDVPKHFRDDVGLVLKQAVDRFKKRIEAAIDDIMEKIDD